MTDNSGNTSTYTSGQLHASNNNIDITLTGAGDTTAPQLAGVTRSNPGTLDITNNSPAASFAISMTDNMSGLGIPTLNFTSPSGGQSTNGAVCVQRSEATLTSAIYDCDVYFSQHSESGNWIPDLLITDGAGNSAHFTNAQLQALNIDIRVALTGTSDTLAPVLTSASITFANPPADNIPYGGAVVTIGGDLTDDLSGLNGTSKVRYTSPSGVTVEGDISGNGSTFTSNVTLPQYTAGGTWSPSIYVQDVATNSHTYTSSELQSIGSNIAITVTKNVTETVAAGGTATTDYENDGATSNNPIEASVTTPTGGAVSIVIVQSNSINDATNGYTFFDRQISISAPVESVENPLTLTFMIDSSKVPQGQNASTLQVTRNGVVVPDCTDQTTASPNPCIFSRVDQVGGDIEVKIHTTTASAWASGFPTQTYTWKGFSSPLKDYPNTNSAQAGQAIPVRFKLGGVKDSAVNVFADGQPTTQRVNCTTKELIGSPEGALSVSNKGLTRTGKVFEYGWKTSKSWNNTCRIFSMQFDDGSVQKAFFKF